MSNDVETEFMAACELLDKRRGQKITLEGFDLIDLMSMVIDLTEEGLQEKRPWPKLWFG